MKNWPLLLAFLLTFITEVKSQVPYDTIKSSFPVKMGKVTLKDGTYYNFSNLSYSNDTISFVDTELNERYYNLKEIEKITKKNRSTFGGLCIGAGTGLVLGSGIHSALTGIVEAFTFGLLDEDDASKKAKRNFLVSTTLIGAGIGALTGTFIYHNKTVYTRRIESIGIQPVIVPTHSKMPLVGLSFCINLK